jgi:chloride channel protein, CIC family
VLQQVVVGESMSHDFDTVPAVMTVGELAERIGQHDPAVTRHQGVFVMGNDGRLAGIITRSDLMRALEQDPSGKMTVLDASSRDLVVSYPDQVLYDAAAHMLRANVGRMPVVDRNQPGIPIGYLGRSGIMSARLRRLEEEYVRDPGWMGRRRTGS